ncbi:hypothetical protein I4U23_019381 [Adineta vaga]|nr:hypothetical protein I4U23_019381 [Adineta vaga]
MLLMCKNRIHISMSNIKSNSKNTKRRINEINQSLSINIFKPINEKLGTLKGLNDGFIHYQILTDVLLRMKITNEDFYELMCLCRSEINNDQDELKILHEFQETYSSTQALWWYTRESFVYLLLNLALRFQDIDLLYLFRFFICDLQNQLKIYQCTESIRVYRGQYMSEEELQILKSSLGQFISTNAFLSTSISMDEALSFLDHKLLTDNFQRVLFVIDANPKIKGIKPFANIASQSYFPDEQEILFMIGSIFQIMKIYFSNKENVWIIHMTLSNDSKHELKSVFDLMKNEYGAGETGLLSLGRILRQMGKFDQAEKFYQRFLDEKQDENDQNLAQCYHLLGNNAFDQGKYVQSFKYHLKSLEIKKENFPSNDPSLAYSLNSLGIVSWKKGNKEQALGYYQQALHIWIEAYGEDDLRVAMCYNNIAIIYDDEKNYFQALEYYEKTLSIRLKHLPKEHYQIGDIYNNIGTVHHSLNHLDLALEYLHGSLEIFEKILTSKHPSIASTCKNIGIIYEMKKNFIDALRFYNKAENIFHQTLTNQHSDVIEINRLIRRVTSQLT